MRGEEEMKKYIDIPETQKIKKIRKKHEIPKKRSVWTFDLI